MKIPIYCEQIRISAMANSDGEEGPIPTAQIDEHVRECAACREEVELLCDSSPLPPTVQRVNSTENIWQSLELRLHELASVDGGLNTVTIVSARRTINDSVSRRLALCSTASCLLVVGLIFWSVNQSASRRYLDGRELSNSLLIMISESAIGGLDDSAEEELVTRTPFSDETNADDIVLAVVDRTFKREGTSFVRMKLVSSYKGRIHIGSHDEGQPPFYVESGLPLASPELFGPGNRLGLYLDGDIDRGWTVTSIRDLAAGAESWQANVERFCDVLLACETDDSAARYQELLASADSELLDAPAYYALMAHPCPHADEAVRPLWHQAIAMHFPQQNSGLPGGGGGGGFVGAGAIENGDAGQVDVAGQQPGGQQGPGTVQNEIPPSVLEARQLVELSPPLAVAQVLGRIHDHESAESVLQYAISLPSGVRADYFDLLPDLCRNAEPRLLLLARDSLASLLSESDESPAAAEVPVPERNAQEDVRDTANHTSGRQSDRERVKAAIDQLQMLLDARIVE